MMKLPFFALTAFAASVSFAAAGTVNFDADATGFYGPNDGSQNYNPGSYQGAGLGGIIFNTPILVQAAGFGAGPGQTGNVGQQATPPFGGDPKGQSFGGSFDGFTVSSLSIQVGDSGGDEDIFRLFGFDSNGAQIADSGELKSLAAIPVSISGTGIASFFLEIEDTPTNFDGSSFFDNIVFAEEAAVVPLPATLPLIGAGLLGLGIAGRRKRNA